MEIGTKVRVTIPDDKAHTWARNYLLALQGLIGVVLATKEDFSNREGFRCLVRFDKPPKDPSAMATPGRKLAQFWIPNHSLTKEDP